MKGIALILALIIFSTSVKASSFVSGVVGAVKGDVVSHSCCKTPDNSDIKDCSDTEQNEEESGCCEGNECNCACCLHVAFLQQYLYDSNHLSDFSEVKFGYSFLYRADYLTAVFHPPTKV